MRRRVVLSVDRLDGRCLPSTWIPFAPAPGMAWSSTYAPWSAAYTSLPTVLSPAPVPFMTSGPAVVSPVSAPLSGGFVFLYPTTMPAMPSGYYVASGPFGAY